MIIECLSSPPAEQHAACCSPTTFWLIISSTLKICAATWEMRLAESSRSLDIAAIRVPKASDVLAESLRERILEDRLPEGTRLPTERELVTKSGLSRASVREA